MGGVLPVPPIMLHPLAGFLQLCLLLQRDELTRYILSHGKYYQKGKLPEGWQKSDLMLFLWPLLKKNHDRSYPESRAGQSSELLGGLHSAFLMHACAKPAEHL